MRFCTAICLIAAARAGSVASSYAQSANPAAPPTSAVPACASAEFRQFDFWVGEWTVVVRDTQVAGVNRITPILGGCALHEQWHGATGGSGESFSIYDRQTGKWHQTWIGNDGVMLLLDGRVIDGRMVLTGSRPAPQKPGVKRLDRITWIPLESGVRQLWEVSDDAGATWRTVFDGRYSKRPATAPGALEPCDPRLARSAVRASSVEHARLPLHAEDRWDE